MTAIEYPEIDALETALAQHDLRLTVATTEERLAARSWRRIAIVGADGFELTVAADDEHGDARDDNQAMLLHLVLASCETVEEAADFEEWAIEAEMKGSEAWKRDLYDELRARATRMRDVVGHDLRALSPWDVSMNAGAAQALRAR